MCQKDDVKIHNGNSVGDRQLEVDGVVLAGEEAELLLLLTVAK